MGEHLCDMLTYLAKNVDHPLTIVECGTIRNPSFEDHEDGLSTYFIAKWVRDTGNIHKFTSVEIEHGHLMAAKFFLEQNRVDEYVQWGLADAETVLQHFGEHIDFCYLDAGADIHQNLAQFRRAQFWMREPGFIVIDDVYDPRNANRGLLTVPIAQNEGFHTGKIAGRMAAIAFGDIARIYTLPEHGVWTAPPRRDNA